MKKHTKHLIKDIYNLGYCPTLFTGMASKVGVAMAHNNCMQAHTLYMYQENGCQQ